MHQIIKNTISLNNYCFVHIKSLYLVKEEFIMNLLNWKQNIIMATTGRMDIAVAGADTGRRSSGVPN